MAGDILRHVCERDEPIGQILVGEIVTDDIGEQR